MSTPPEMLGRTSLDEAAAWIDAQVRRLAGEDVRLAALAGRVLAGNIVAACDEPAFARAVADGLAVRADETVGASAYNPLAFRVVAPGAPLAPGAAARLNAGDPLPAGADTVVPLDHVHESGPHRCEIIEAAPPGRDVELARSEFARGATLFAAGHVLNAADLGLLALAGVASASVVRRPRVGIVLVGRDVTRDADGPMLRALVERDGGEVVSAQRIGRDPAALRQALAAPAVDALVVVGGTGRGPDDATVPTLADTGGLAVRDVALSPGGSAAIGRIAGGALALLLPGRPAACLWSYELIAGRAVRRLAGRDPGLPFAKLTLTLARKIVSAIGVTEIVPVRGTGDGRVEPLTAVARDSLAVLAQADGIVIVAEGSEGCPAGAAVTVYLLRPASA